MLKFIQYLLRESEEVSHHVTIMRSNPLTVGHESVVNEVLNDAKQDNNAGHTIFLTRSHDSKKNPLTPEQKLKHANAAFPHANIQLTSPDAPTLLHQASALHDQGVNRLNLKVGSDRVDDFQKILNTYNGVKGKHGFYNFNSINVKPVGAERADDDDSVAGASGTKMRAAVANNNRQAFHAMAPSTMSPEQKDDMFKDVYHGMMAPVQTKPKKVKTNDGNMGQTQSK